MAITEPLETTTTSAGPVALRPLERGDRASLLEIFAGLGERSRRQRFLTPKPRLLEADLRRLTTVDDHDHAAVLAVDSTDDRPVGVARFFRDHTQPDLADVAVAVVDAWQGKGVGSLLTGALARRAVEVGIRRFTVLMACDNQAARRLAHHGSQVVLVEAASGTVELVVTLPASEVGPTSWRDHRTTQRTTGPGHRAWFTRRSLR
jgi:RimJ/RimL family protein N-acetyltransferase